MMSVTRDDAVHIAERFSARNNRPWDARYIRVRTWRLWPFARVWSIRSYVPSDGAINKVRLNGGNGKVLFSHIRYDPGFKLPDEF